MEYRAWKKQNGAGESIRTSLLGYGCMRFPTTPEGAIDEPRAEALLNAARDAGVNYFDTAYPYHGGQSEPFVGRVIAKWPRESFYLATKMPLWQCGSLEEAQHIFEEQLRRLGVEYIDFYLLHSLHVARYDRAKEMGIVDWLWEQKKLGRIRSFGFSCHDNAAGLEHILRDQPWDFCQLQYNYLDIDDRAEEISGDRGYQLTEELNIPLIIMEPIKGGTLANLPPEAEAPLKALRPEASDASWALRWVGSHRNVHVILSGMSAEDQLTDNLDTFARFEPLTAAETAAVEQTAAFLHSRIKIGCTGLPVLYALPHGGGHPGQLQHLEQAGDVRPARGHQAPVGSPLPRCRKGQPLRPLRQVRGGLPPASAHPQCAGPAAAGAGSAVICIRKATGKNRWLFSLIRSTPSRSYPALRGAQG